MAKEPSLLDIPLGQLKEALNIRRQIDTLQARLSSLPRTGGSTSIAAKSGKKTMSAAARAKIAAAQRARWAKVKGATTPAKTSSAPKSAKKKGGITAAGRRKLSQMMKARWAARRRKGGKAPNARG